MRKAEIDCGVKLNVTAHWSIFWRLDTRLHTYRGQDCNTHASQVYSRLGRVPETPTPFPSQVTSECSSRRETCHSYAIWSTWSCSQARVIGEMCVDGESATKDQLLTGFLGRRLAFLLESTPGYPFFTCQPVPNFCAGIVPFLWVRRALI